MAQGFKDPIKLLLKRHFRSGRVLAKVPSSGSKEVSRAVDAARAAFKEWSALTGMERGRTLIAAAAKVR